MNVCVIFFVSLKKKKRPYNWPSQKKKSKGKKVMFCFSSQPFSTRPIMKKTAFVWQRCFGSGNRFFFFFFHWIKYIPFFCCCCCCSVSSLLSVLVIVECCYSPCLRSKDLLQHLLTASCSSLPLLGQSIKKKKKHSNGETNAEINK